MKLEFSRQIFLKIHLSNFTKISPGGAELLRREGQSHGGMDRHTDRWTDMMKLIVSFF
jgi:hypothetical protein